MSFLLYQLSYYWEKGGKSQLNSVWTGCGSEKVTLSCEYISFSICKTKYFILIWWTKHQLRWSLWKPRENPKCLKLAGCRLWGADWVPTSKAQILPGEDLSENFSPCISKRETRVLLTPAEWTAGVVQVAQCWPLVGREGHGTGGVAGCYHWPTWTVLCPQESIRYKGMPRSWRGGTLPGQREMHSLSSLRSLDFILREWSLFCMSWLHNYSP